MIIFGNGEIAQMAACYMRDRPFEGFCVDDEHVSGELIPLSKLSNMAPVHVALSYRGMNKVRESAFNRIKERGNSFVSYISHRAVDMSHKIGDNAFILENNVLQMGVTLGDNVMLWSGNHIGHGSTIGDHTYVSSHVVISGHCNIGKRCFFGVNASVKDFTTIGDDCFITMGAIVTKDMPAGSVAIDRDIITGDKAQRIKDKYFN